MPRANPTEHVFYVYVLMDGRKPGPFHYGHWKFSHEPIYVGKGKNGRYKGHLTYTPYWQGNGHKGKKIRKIQREGYDIPVRLVRIKLQEWDAFELEIKLIAKIGRHDLGTGPLTNRTAGGDGISGQVVSKRTRQKLSNAIKKYAEENKHLVLERAARANQTKASKSKEDKEATRKKQSEAAKKARAKLSKVEKKRLTNARVETMLSKPKRERKRKTEKFKQSMSSRTPEQKALSAEKKRASWFAKPQKERDAIIAKRRKAYTDKSDAQKRTFARKMSRVNKLRYSTWTEEQFRIQASKISAGRNKV